MRLVTTICIALLVALALFCGFLIYVLCIKSGERSREEERAELTRGQSKSDTN